MPIALEVLVPLPLEPLSYLQPLDQPDGPIGGRVVVPWQGGARIGLVVGVHDVPAGRGLELKHAVAWLDQRPFLPERAVDALRRIARYAAAPMGVVLASLAPAGFHEPLRWLVRATAGAGTLAQSLVPEGWTDAVAVPAEELELLRGQGLIDERVERVTPTVRVLVPTRQADSALDGAQRANQRVALARLWDLERVASAAELARDADVPASAVRALVEKGYAAYADVPAEPPALEAAPDADSAAIDVPAASVPPEGDGAVVGGLRRQRLAALLPRLRADLSAGGSVLVLVPEHALLAEAAGALAELPLQLLWGETTDAQRSRLFEDLPEGGPVVLLGTYLALLAPLPSLARVVVLEAGSPSYKLQAGARLFVPAAASIVAASAGAPLTLADIMAGPDLVARVAADDRRNLPLPRLRLHVADLRGSSNWPLHPDLILVLRQVAERGRQALLIAPRRGYSAALGCRDCGWMADCPNCDLTLRYHQQDRKLRCHQCGFVAPPPTVCPTCGGVDLEPQRGAGTQWIASQVKTLLDGFPTYRFDSDRKDDLAVLLAGEPGVVVGTSALLRLPRLPDVALVGVTQFDSQLGRSDFRAEEEAMRFLLQLAEFAPDRRALVVVQTYQADHAVLESLAADPPEPAVEVAIGRLLERRRRFAYPPFTALAKLQVTARDRLKASAAADALSDELQRRGASPEEVLGPAAASVARVRGQYAFQLFLRVSGEDRRETLLEGLPNRLGGARLLLDVDPRDVEERLEGTSGYTRS